MGRQRLYSWIVLCLLCVCVCVAPEARAAPASGSTPPVPTDVPKDSPYYEAVTDSLRRKLFDITNGLFGLQVHVTRQEISLILWRKGGCVRLTGACPLKDEGFDPASDTGMAAWWVMDRHILDEIPGKPGYFEGEREINRSEAARCLNQFLIYDTELSQKVVTLGDPKELKFADVDVTENSYAREISLCVKLGIIDKTEKNAEGHPVFRPADALTRGEWVVMIYRYNKLRDEKLAAQSVQAA